LEVLTYADAHFCDVAITESTSRASTSGCRRSAQIKKIDTTGCRQLLLLSLPHKNKKPRVLTRHMAARCHRRKLAEATRTATHKDTDNLPTQNWLN
jgi:hypothetical protein